MELRKISENFTVSPQITAADVEAIKAAGFRAIICNRPDAESHDQPAFAEIAAVAQAAGIKARHVPVSGTVQDDDLVAFDAVMNEVQRPVLAYCRTGTRSAMLWSLHQADKRPMLDILAATKAAGYDMSGLTQRIANDGKTPTEADDAQGAVGTLGAK